MCLPVYEASENNFWGIASVMLALQNDCSLQDTQLWSCVKWSSGVFSSAMGEKCSSCYIYKKTFLGFWGSVGFCVHRAGGGWLVFWKPKSQGTLITSLICHGLPVRSWAWHDSSCLLVAHLYTRENATKAMVRQRRSYRGLKNGSESVQIYYLERCLFYSGRVAFFLFPMRILGYLYFYFPVTGGRVSVVSIPVFFLVSLKKFLSFADVILWQKKIPHAPATSSHSLSDRLPVEAALCLRDG